MGPVDEIRPPLWGLGLFPYVLFLLRYVTSGTLFTSDSTILKAEYLPSIYVSCLGSILSSIPMIVDLLMEQKFSREESGQRHALIASLLLPNGLILLAGGIGGFDLHLGSVIVCAYCIRQLMMRLVTVKYASSCDSMICIDYRIRHWAIASSVCSVARVAHRCSTSRFLLDLFLCVPEGIFLWYFWSLQEGKAEMKHKSVTLSVAAPVVSEVISSMISYIFPEYYFVAGIVVDCILAVIAFNECGKRARADMQQKASREFRRYIAHEIRTPLNTSSIGLKLALTQDTEDNLRAALAAVEEATDILNDLLLADKVDTGHMVLEREDIDALSFMQDTFGFFSVQARSKQIMYTLNAETELDAVILNVDRKKYSQVIKNFISNAMKFTPVGGSVSVNAFLRRTGCGGNNPVFRVEVVDSGVGIKPPDLKRLFHEVVQFDAARLQAGGGSGLGLTIVKAIMDAHGGKVECSSNYGRGSTFAAEIEISGRRERKSKMVTRASSRENRVDRRLLVKKVGSDRSVGNCTVSSTSSRTSSETISSCSDSPPGLELDNSKIRRILLVEDSTLNMKMMQKLIKPYSSEVLVAYDGLMAADIVQHAKMNNETPIDIVLTDYHMPGMDGMQLAAHLRMRGYGGHIVMLTGDSSSSVKDVFLNQGGNQLMLKPVNLKSIVAMFDEYHAARRQQRI